MQALAEAAFHGAQAGIPCLEVFIARGPDGELRQQASVLRPTVAKLPAELPSEEALAAGALPISSVSGVLDNDVACLAAARRVVGMWEAGCPSSEHCGC